MHEATGCFHQSGPLHKNLWELLMIEAQTIKVMCRVFQKGMRFLCDGVMQI